MGNINWTLIIIVALVVIVGGLVVAMLTGYDLGWFPEFLNRLLDKWS